MNLVDRLRPRWKNSDPAIRIEAVTALTDQGLLRQIAESDFSETVRAAAFNQLTEVGELLDMAKGHGPWALRAAERLTEPRQIARLAREAADPKVRESAVARITDDAILQRIATSDIDPGVRQSARRKRTTGHAMRNQLESLLLGLEITPAKPEGYLYIAGGLREVCAALLDGAFHVNGVALSPRQPHTSSVTTPGDDQELSAEPPFVELLAVRNREAAQATDGRATIYYRIKVWRLAVDEYWSAIEERRYELTPNPALWSTSSNGGPRD